MSDLIAKLNAAAEAPPASPEERLAIYHAARKLADAVEDPFDTIWRVQTSLEASEKPLSGVSLAKTAGAGTRLVSHILSFLASHALVREAGEDLFAATNVTSALARPGFAAGLAHSYEVQLLANVVPAPGANLVLLVDEIIVSNVGARARTTEMDMTMMGSLAAVERTERQWDELLDRAGLRILSKTTYDDKVGLRAIVTMPKEGAE